MTVSSKDIRFKVPSKRTLLIATCGLLILAVFSTSIALYQRSQNVKATQVAAARADEAKAEKQRQADIKTLKDQLQTAETKRKGACEYIAVKAKTKPTASYVVVPNVYCL